MANLEELSALSTIMSAFSRFSATRKDLYSTEAQDLIGNTAHVVSTTEFKMTRLREELRNDVANTQRFTAPYIKPILAGVAIFEQRPELFQPLMTTGQFENTQTFFPPVTVE